MVRKHIYFSGDVQGVGFRYRSCYIAQSLGLTGWGGKSMGRQGRDGSPGRRKLDPADAGANPETTVDRGEPYGNHGDSVRGGEGIPDTVE